MKVVEGVAELLEHRRTRGAGATGFVPTLGALHAGHLSLLRRAKAENARAWASIFVNPAQFDDPADLGRYPRTTEQDLAVLRDAGCDLAFLPRAEEIYRDGYRYRVSENELSPQLEGAERPGHFDGVLTVVLKLLLLARPERAYFGEKDFQQLQLVEGLAHAFFLDTRIVRCPTVREPDGLAMSSRNRLLSPAERARAPALHRVLAASLAARQPPAEAADALAREGFEVDYVADRDGRRLAAVRLGRVRLIDNVEQ
jgi:pantoate--beta-alanine ligase